MATKISTKKVHLTRPTNERKVMCGRSARIEETDQPRKVTCLTCKKLYVGNKQWYANMKRKLTRAKKS